MLVLDFVGYGHYNHPCFPGTHIFLKLIGSRLEVASHSSQPFIASESLWKQKKRNVLCAYCTEAMHQIVSPAVEQIAKFILKLPSVYLNQLIKMLLALFERNKNSLCGISMAKLNSCNNHSAFLSILFSVIHHGRAICD